MKYINYPQLKGEGYWAALPSIPILSVIALYEKNKLILFLYAE